MNIWTEERQSLALAAAEGWLGTPYADRMAKRNVGVDCIHLVNEILVAAEVIPARPIGHYDPRVGLGTQSDELRDRIVECLHLEILPTANVEFGDIAIFRTGQRSSHCGFCVPGSIYHSLARRCVTKSPWGHWRAKASCLLRLTQTGWKQEPRT